MQNDISKKKRAATICAAIMIGLMGTVLAIILYPMLGEVCDEWLAVGILLVYALMIVAIIVGVIAALRERLQELEQGEEEDAKQY